MTTKQYSKPQVIELGDAIETTLIIFPRGYTRDSRFFNRYWFRYRP